MMNFKLERQQECYFVEIKRQDGQDKTWNYNDLKFIFCKCLLILQNSYDKDLAKLPFDLWWVYMRTLKRVGISRSS